MVVIFLFANFLKKPSKIFSSLNFVLRLSRFDLTATIYVLSSPNKIIQI